MDLFGRKAKQKAREELQGILVQLSARLTCAEALIATILLAENEHIRGATLDGAKQFIVQMKDLQAPDFISDHQAYRDELSRALQVFINTIK
jgi:hypothetical protein